MPQCLWGGAVTDNAALSRAESGVGLNDLLGGEPTGETMKHFERTACVIWISVFTGMAINDPRGPSLAWSVFAFMAVPSVLAYLAGRRDGKPPNAGGKP